MLARAATLLMALAPWVCTTQLTQRADAHGGTYVGPGSGLPAGPGTPAPGGGAGASTSGGSPTGAIDPTAWQQWWAFHRDAFLNLKSTLARNAVRSDEAFFGVAAPLRRGDDRRPPELLRKRVLPALLGALERERNPDVLTGAALALAKLTDTSDDPDGRVPAALRGLLGSSNQEVAESAAISLGILAHPSAAPLLSALLVNDAAGRAASRSAEIPTRTRAFAAYALGILGQRTHNTDVRRFCVRALSATLDAEAHAASNDVRVACTLALGLVRLEPEHAPDGAEGAQDSPASSRQAEIAWLLPRLEDARAPETIRAHLPVALARIVHAGSGTLERDLERRFVAALTPSSRAGTLMQQSSGIALGLLLDNDQDETDRAGVVALLRQADEGGPLARRWALIALARAAARDGKGAGGGRDGATLRDARAFLTTQLGRTNGLLRPWCAIALGVLEYNRIALGELAAPESLRALRTALEKHPGPIEAGAYCLALAMARDATSSEVILAQARQVQDEELQAQACLALGMLGGRDSILPLRAIVVESRLRPLVMRDGSIALALLGDRALVAALLAWLRDATNGAMLSATADALGWVGDASCIAPLCALVEDRDVPDRVRAFAAVALGRLCDRELLPWTASLARDLNWALVPPSLFDPTMGSGILDLF